MRRILPLALLLLAPAVMLSTVWHDPYSAGEDDAVYFQPVRALVGEALADGRWPMANPYEATGTALMGDPQTAVMYPVTWLFAVTDSKTAYTLSILLAFALAGIGTFLYLQRLKLVPTAALFGALAFAYGGFMVGHRVHLGMIHTAAFLPWGLWCLEGLRRRRAAPAALWLVAILYLAITSGHWPALVHMTLVWGVYFLLRARPFGRALAYALGAGILALLLAAPQLQASFDLIGQATRQRLGYALAGENSFFPPAAVLELFPFLMGSRTPNLFPQSWWGPGHLCEVLGYVGLVTLVLATATLVRLYRKASAPLTPVVRTWTWILLGAGLFMLGYWLPTYRLVHALPVLGVVRCPARMVLAVTLGLATLAAVGMHVVLQAAASEDRLARLRRTLRRLATVGLPVTMILLLLLLAVTAWLLPAAWAERIPWPMEGGTNDVLEAVRPTNPAVWIPLVLCALTLLVVRLWLWRPRAAAGLLVVLLLADLFVITRFVDVPGSDAPPYDPGDSPAAVWLHEHWDPASYRVWSLTDSYHERPAERLVPKSAHALGISTLNSYGPFQSPAHAHLLELRLWGTTRSWEQLVRRNHLLSLYGVRYLLATEAHHRAVIESVRVSDASRAPDAENLLGDTWRLARSAQEDDILRLHASSLWPPSEAEQTVALGPATRYRIALDARGPEGGAAHFLRAEIREDLGGEAHGFDANPYVLMAYPEQMGEDWRHFEWDFTTPDDLPTELTFRVYSMSERPVEVREITLRPSTPDVPLGVPTGFPTGERVYEEVAVLAPLHAADAPVHVYANRLWRPPGARLLDPATPPEVETLKWDPTPWLEDKTRPLPDLGFSVPAAPTPVLLFVTLPALLLYGLLLLAAGRRRRHPA